jgi:hypothetical protein
VDDDPDVLDGSSISERIGIAASSGASLDPAIARQLALELGAHPGDVRVHTGATR